MFETVKTIDVENGIKWGFSNVIFSLIIAFLFSYDFNWLLFCIVYTVQGNLTMRYRCVFIKQFFFFVKCLKVMNNTTRNAVNILPNLFFVLTAKTNKIYNTRATDIWFTKLFMHGKFSVRVEHK